ncbi:serine/arginine repetitive matrix protein 1-like [Pogonomyrmex barbatus]|uniref:Serine/arginine repetitive matrix protein 1-like n=1 Tax=Pogonomyrmex barbatus TaxID=144034 RepID=A0A6I9WJC5_9HYME|nr:serine/arginine repetitive matrix protein 1-like [Pogonomyrmex barbatus]
MPQRNYIRAALGIALGLSCLQPVTGCELHCDAFRALEPSVVLPATVNAADTLPALRLTAVNAAIPALPLTAMNVAIPFQPTSDGHERHHTGLISDGHERRHILPVLPLTAVNAAIPRALPLTAFHHVQEGLSRPATPPNPPVSGRPAPGRSLSTPISIDSGSRCATGGSPPASIFSWGPPNDDSSSPGRSTLPTIRQSPVPRRSPPPTSRPSTPPPGRTPPSPCTDEERRVSGRRARRPTDRFKQRLLDLFESASSSEDSPACPADLPRRLRTKRTHRGPQPPRAQLHPSDHRFLAAFWSSARSRTGRGNSAPSSSATSIGRCTVTLAASTPKPPRRPRDCHRPRSCHQHSPSGHTEEEPGLVRGAGSGYKSLRAHAQRPDATDSPTRYSRGTQTKSR